MQGAVLDAVEALDQLATSARAEQITAPGIDPLTSVVLGICVRLRLGQRPARQHPRSFRVDPSIAAAVEHVGNRRAGFEKLLADANSPQEAAYLWKALAAGYSLTDIQKFDQVIHPHGKDLNWLNQHLNPQVNNVDRRPGNLGKWTLGYKD